MGLKFFMYCSYRTSPVGSLLPIEPAYHACHSPPSHPTSPLVLPWCPSFLRSKISHHPATTGEACSPFFRPVRLPAVSSPARARLQRDESSSTRSPHLWLGSCFVRHAEGVETTRHAGTGARAPRAVSLGTLRVTSPQARNEIKSPHGDNKIK